MAIQEQLGQGGLEQMPGIPTGVPRSVVGQMYHREPEAETGHVETLAPFTISAESYTPPINPQVMVTRHRVPRQPSHNRSTLIATGAAVVAGLALAASFQQSGSEQPTTGTTILQPTASATTHNQAPSLAPNPTASNKALVPIGDPIKDYLLSPLSFAAYKNNCYAVGSAAVGSFTLRFRAHNQVQQMVVPASEMILANCSQAIGATISNDKSLDLVNHAYKKIVTVNSASLQQTAGFSAKAPAATASVVSLAKLDQEQGLLDICTATNNQTIGCPGTTVPKSALTPAELAGDQASAQMLIALSVQNTCAANETADLKQAIASSYIKQLAGLSTPLPANDVNVEISSNSIPSYIVNFTKDLQAKGAVTSVPALQSLFGQQVAVPVTCNM